MVDSVVVTIFSFAPLRTRAGVSRLLDALERDKAFTPTRWGPDERARLPFNRDELLNEVAAFESEFYMPGLRRTGKPAYSGYFSARSKGPNYLRLDFSNLADKFLHGVFELGDSLAEQLKPEFGFIHPVWYAESSQDYGAAGATDLRMFEAFGPSSACARTWFGPNLVDLINRDLLESSCAFTSRTNWDGVRLDLADKPWESSVQELMRHQTEVMERLRPTGVFGDYSDLVDYKRGPRFSLPVSPIVYFGSRNLKSDVIVEPGQT